MDPSMQTFSLNDVTLAVPDSFATPGLVKKLTDGTYEYDEANAARRCIRPGVRVLELGAGLGLVSTIAAMRAGPENVLSVEANPGLIEVIEGNLSRNGQSGVQLRHGAVTGWAKDGATAPFRLGNVMTSSRLSKKAGSATVEVPLIPIGALIKEHAPHVVMMDIEGAEADLFDSLWKCPLRFLVLELHPKQYGAAVIKRICDWASAMDMTYDPGLSRGKTLGFRRVWGGDA